jgi:hypothetical protein
MRWSPFSRAGGLAVSKGKGRKNPGTIPRRFQPGLRSRAFPAAGSLHTFPSWNEQGSGPMRYQTSSISMIFACGVVSHFS